MAQDGYVYKGSDGKSFHVRYYVTEIVDGQPKRVQRSHKLCEKNRATGHATVTSLEVQLLCKDFMLKINREQHTSQSLQQDLLITDFWEHHYLPYNEDILPLTGKPRKKPSTLRGYKQIWKQHLEKHFGKKTLQQYEPNHGTQLLQSLTSTQRSTTLKHIRAVGSSLFKRAVVERRIKANPWHDVVMPDDAIKPEDTEHYTMEEAENAISALVDHVDAQLVLALSCFLGLGPAEIGGLQWSDIDSNSVHIRRNKVRGDVTTPKTLERMASVPLLDQVRVPLELWREKCGGTSDGGWLIADLPNLINRVIKPHISGKNNPAKLKECVRCKLVPEASGVAWKGLYAGRRGACTAVIEATGGNYAVAQALLRHKKMTTTLNVYKKQITPDAFQAGMNLFQKSLTK
jgi:integrase